jgi:hypothetical protein
MEIDTFIIAVFCAVEDWLEGEQPLRRRSPKPKQLGGPRSRKGVK